MIPCWLYILGRFYIDPSEVTIPYVDIIQSLLPVVIPCAVGLIIRHCGPKVADKIAKSVWHISVIFYLYFFTFGTYVNWYMYKIMASTPIIIPAVLLLPLMGYTCGFLLTLLACRDKSTAVTISIETVIQNASIPIIILQGSFPQPEGDLAAVMPVALALFYTIPLIIALIILTIYRRYHPKSLDSLDKEDAEEDDNESQDKNESAFNGNNEANQTTDTAKDSIAETDAPAISNRAFQSDAPGEV